MPIYERACKATPCASDFPTYQRVAGFAQEHLNPNLGKSQRL